MRKKLLRTIARIVTTRTWTVAAVLLVLTVLFSYLSTNLSINMNLTSLLPKGDPMVDEFNYIFEEFNGSSTVFIVVKGDMPDMIRYARDVQAPILDLRTWIGEKGSESLKKQIRELDERVSTGLVEGKDAFFSRVDAELPREYVRDRGLMLVKRNELANIREIYHDPAVYPLLRNFNEGLEKEYIFSDEKVSTQQKERNSVYFLDGLETWAEDLNIYLSGADMDGDSLARDAAAALALGSQWLVSPDRDMLIIQALPTFSMMDLDYLMPGINGIEELAKSLAEDHNVNVGLTGGIVLARDEMVAGMEDSMLLTILALVGVFILFVVTFRMIAAPLWALINLGIGLIWAMGFTYFLVDSLNLFTLMMAVVLVGLGIDYSIHIISVYSELRNKGIAPAEAMSDTLVKTGTGIITGSITTSAAFFTMMIARSQGMAEFGLVNGAGILVIMIASIFTLPTLLMLREKFLAVLKTGKRPYRDVSYTMTGRLAEGIAGKKMISIAGLVLVSLAAWYYADTVTMDYNYLNMEPVGLESIQLNDEIIDRFNMSSDPTMMTASSLEENIRFTKEAQSKSSISYIESISDYLPSEEEQDLRRPVVGEIHHEMMNAAVPAVFSENDRAGFRDELLRLIYNVIEMQDLALINGQDMLDRKASRLTGDPENTASKGILYELMETVDRDSEMTERLAEWQKAFSPGYRELVLDMADTSRISAADLPASIRDKFISRDGSRFLLTLYPKGNVWHIDYLERHTEEVLSISHSIAGTPPMFYYLLKIIGKDGRRASILTILTVFVFLAADFRSLKKAVIALIPLLFGVLWMVGIMGLSGIQFTLLNIMAIPLIIGIGIDDGVHILHRSIAEGPGKVHTVFSSTGKAVIITSLTTMLSFGSLVFATYRGYGSLGIALFIGVGTCLVASLLILPIFVAGEKGKK